MTALEREQLRIAVENETIEMNKSLHEARNKDVPEDKMRIEDVVINCIPESRFPFEFFGWRSPEMVNEMKCFIKYAKGKSCLLDVGAYAGIFSLVFTSINETAYSYAFEPFHDPYLLLYKTTEGNGRIFPTQTALSDKCGRIDLFSWGGHLEKNKRVEEQVPISVNSITGDSFCFAQWPNLYPDVLKIDCESSELDVLRGLFNTISKYHPTIFLELHYEQLKYEEVIEIIKLIGYWQYKIIDTQTDTEIPLSDLQNQTGEKRIILI